MGKAVIGREMEIISGGGSPWVLGLELGKTDEARKEEVSCCL